MASPQLAADPTAVFGRRMVATLIDGMVVLGPAVALATAEFEYLAVDDLGVDPQEFCDRYIDATAGICANAADVNDRVYFSDSSMATSGLAFWGLGLVLLVLLQGLTGWTIGKLLTGIRTVREDGRPAGILKAFLRWVFWIVDGQPCGLPLVGFITGLTTKGHRRVGDMVAKTFVVRSSAAGAPIVVPGLTGPPPTPMAYSTAGPWTGTAMPPTGDPTASVWTPPGGPAPGSASPSAPGSSGPQWDPARNTYIQWDPAQSQWLQWDEAARTWSPILGQ